MLPSNLLAVVVIILQNLQHEKAVRAAATVADRRGRRWCVDRGCLLLFSFGLRAKAACVFVALGNFVASLSCVSAFSKDVFIAPGGKEEEDEEAEEEDEGEEEKRVKTSRLARELISPAANSRGRWSEPR